MTDAFWRDPPWSGGKGGYRMGLHPIAPEQWLPDRISAAERTRKQQLLDDPDSGVFAAIDGSQSGQQKILDAVTAFLGTDAAPPSDAWPPLVNAALMVPDDLCLMEHDAGSYRLTAACVCSPSFWRLAEKIGRTLDGIHAPVPTLNDKLAPTMLQFFDRLPDNAVFERRNWLIHTSAEPYHPQSDPWPSTPATQVDGLVMRSERQTLRRLDAGTVVFTIRVSSYPLTDIVSHRNAARDLLAALATKDDAERSATGYRYFGPVVVNFLTSLTQARP